MSDGLQLIVGLGNPGVRYRYTRHNVGAAFVEGLATLANAVFKAESRFSGSICKARVGSREITLLVPTTFMNDSGRSVTAYIRYYKIPLEEVLIAHDELDMPPGVARFKQGGGDGGHKGLHDIIETLGGERGFNRLRIGIGHPGAREDVLSYVLGRPSMSDLRLINLALEEAHRALPHALRGDWQKAMTALHSARISEGEE